ncbi:MAG: carbohydrate kinase family protein [Ardenticatenaceae bacterium]|nr:carbohydrate kinase family protein [Ardenticatenaceae bacterium]HBY97716.1 carbohydrate kinase family protein [Chloroflexota bacterium]
MAPSIVLAGSAAYDYIMFFPGHFSEHILPEHIDRLSVSFLVDSMRKERGGVATNIAYTLALLGEHPTVMATVGQDFGDYRVILEAHGVDTSAIKVIPNEFTASFFVSTDRANRQIANFYTGAMAYAGELSFSDLDYRQVRLAVVSPTDPRAMAKYVRECLELGISLLYDPSQQIVRLSADELLAGIRASELLVVNDYELGMIEKKSGLTSAEIRALVRTLVVTRGEQGSTIINDGHVYHVPAVPPDRIADPTGVGDAYRAGFIKGYLHGVDWETCGRLGSLAATYSLEQIGPQNHVFTHAEFLARYERTFGPAPMVARLLES